MQSPRQPVTRRDFLRVAATTAAPVVVPASALARSRQAAPSQRIALGVVGLGSRGFNLIDAFLREEDAQIVALCDVDSLHYRDRAWGKGTAFGREGAKKRIEAWHEEHSPGGPYRGLGLHADYRELCGREDLDAVVIATPDHWHLLCAFEALGGGKDVYCEKPLTHRFCEGQSIYREVARRKAVFQVGSQQRSDARFRQAAELVLNGHIGKVRTVEVGLPPGYAEPQGDTTVQAPRHTWTTTSGAVPRPNCPTCGRGIIVGGAGTSLSEAAC